jgi:hypothetical protein
VNLQLDHFSENIKPYPKIAHEAHASLGKHYNPKKPCRVDASHRKHLLRRPILHFTPARIELRKLLSVLVRGTANTTCRDG